MPSRPRCHEQPGFRLFVVLSSDKPRSNARQNRRRIDRATLEMPYRELGRKGLIAKNLTSFAPADAAQETREPYRTIFAQRRPGTSACVVVAMRLSWTHPGFQMHPLVSTLPNNDARTLAVAVFVGCLVPPFQG